MIHPQLGGALKYGSLVFHKGHFAVSCVAWFLDTVMSTSSTLSKGELFTALAVTAGAMAVGFLIHKILFSKAKCVKPKVNLDLQKDNPKVVHAFDIEDLDDKAVYCRCWRSKKFPYCDGSHTKHNQETGDNVGPLIIKRKDA